jgi:hypothetical protein
VAPRTNDSTEWAAAAESIINSRNETDKNSSASGAGNQAFGVGFGVGRKVAVGISVEGF